MEFALIYQELFESGVHVKSKTFERALDNELMKRAIKLMMLSGSEDTRTKGIFWAIFGDKKMIKRKNFIDRLCNNKECSWILDAAQIRNRFEANFSSAH